MTSKKFNWVDVLIALLIVGALVGILNRDKLFGREGIVDVVTGSRELIVTAKSQAVPMAIVKAFKLGDAPMAGGNLQEGEIIDVSYRPSEIFQMRDGEVIATTLPDHYDLYVTFKLRANSYASYMEQGNQELKVGVEYYIKTEHAVSYGYIVAIEDVK